MQLVSSLLYDWWRWVLALVLLRNSLIEKKDYVLFIAQMKCHYLVYAAFELLNYRHTACHLPSPFLVLVVVVFVNIIIVDIVTGTGVTYISKGTHKYHWVTITQWMWYVVPWSNDNIYPSLVVPVQWLSTYETQVHIYKSTNSPSYVTII